MIMFGDNGRAVYGKNLIAHGRKDVATAGTRVTLAPDENGATGVYIKALAGNTDTIYVGGLTVTSANGYPLAAGEKLYLPIASTATIYLDSAVSGEGVAYFII